MNNYLLNCLISSIITICTVISTAAAFVVGSWQAARTITYQVVRLPVAACFACTSWVEPEPEPILMLIPSRCQFLS